MYNVHNVHVHTVREVVVIHTVHVHVYVHVHIQYMYASIPLYKLYFIHALTNSLFS